MSTEANWLLKMKCCPTDLTLLQGALWPHPVSTPIPRYEKESIDASSFTDLVEEWYIDSFTINVCISKFTDDNRNDGKDETIYSLSDFSAWMKQPDEDLKKKQLGAITKKLANANNLHQI